jgi:hypothetical protein
VKKVFELTNKNIVLLTPLLLYSLFSSVYLAVSTLGGKALMMIFALLLFFVMTAAFTAGWFNVIKIAVIDVNNEVKTVVKDFVSGVGEYILPSLGLFINVLLISIITLACSYKLGMLLIGDIGVSMETFAKAMESTATLKAFIAGLSLEELTKLSHWNTLLLGVMSLVYFLLILYLPALFYESKNPFRAIFISFKRLFSKQFFKILGIYMLISVVNFVLSLLSAVLTGVTALHFIVTLVNFYFITIVSIGIFYYYYKSFIANKIGCNIDIKI